MLYKILFKRNIISGSHSSNFVSLFSFPAKSLSPLITEKETIFFVEQRSHDTLDPRKKAKPRNKFIFARSIISPILQRTNSLSTKEISKVISKVRMRVII